MYNFKRGDLYERYFSGCLDGMRYRGPDDKQLWQNNENYIAGFVRLSIRDLSINGRQPMFSSCNNYCISFNGEIYNTHTLKNLLAPFGIHYKSSTDTEIFLYAIMHLGIKETMILTDGIFAFAFYDRQRNRLVLARDRTGVKPLYIGIHEKGIIYSSQYDHIINHPYCSNNTLDGSYLGAYLQLGYVPENGGIIQQTRLLLHGHYYIIEQGSINDFRYYSYGNNRHAAQKNNLEEILSEAVQSQLVADVPAGSFMSGGVDSTLVTYYANKAQPIQSFTIGVKDGDIDETEAAAAFAGIFKTKHHSRYFETKHFLSLIRDHVKAFSEPFADYSSLPTLLLSSFAKEKVTVALSGDGGDELFWGYPRNVRAASLGAFYDKNSWRRRGNLLLSKITSPATTDITRHWNRADFADYYYSALQITGAQQWVAKILNVVPRKAYHYKVMNEGGPFHEKHVDAMDFVRKMEIDIHLSRILLKVDRASMYNSLEVRVPLLSKSMLELSERFDANESIINGQGKAVLKQLLAAKTTAAMAFAPKKGFTVPLDHWLQHSLQTEVREQILNMPADLAIFFSKKELERMLQLYMTGKTDAGWLVWAIYCLVQWNNTHRNSIAA